MADFRTQETVASCGCHLTVKLIDFDTRQSRVVDVLHTWSCFQHGAPRGGYL